MKQYHEKVKQKQEKSLRTALQRLLSVLSMSVLGKPFLMISDLNSAICRR
jgi:hypothetical protein